MTLKKKKALKHKCPSAPEYIARIRLPDYFVKPSPFDFRDGFLVQFHQQLFQFHQFLQPHHQPFTAVVQPQGFQIGDGWLGGFKISQRHHQAFELVVALKKNVVAKIKKLPNSISPYVVLCK
jgi:hypothetical protein